MSVRVVSPPLLCCFVPSFLFSPALFDSGFGFFYLPPRELWTRFSLAVGISSCVSDCMRGCWFGSHLLMTVAFSARDIIRLYGLGLPRLNNSRCASNRGPTGQLGRLGGKNGSREDSLNVLTLLNSSTYPFPFVLTALFGTRQQRGYTHGSITTDIYLCPPQPRAAHRRRGDRIKLRFECLGHLEVMTESIHT